MSDQQTPWEKAAAAIEAGAINYREALETIVRAACLDYAAQAIEQERDKCHQQNATLRARLAECVALLTDIRYYRNSWSSEDFDAKIAQVLTLTEGKIYGTSPET